jgi:hypothetical protein
MTTKGGSDATRRAGVQQDTHLRLADGRIQTSRREFEYGFDLFARDRKLLHKFFDGHAIFQILKDNGNGHARPLENPRAAYLTGNTLNGRAL